MKLNCHVVLSLAACLSFAAITANANEDCGSYQNDNSRRLCFHLERIEQKVDRALQLLETGNGGSTGGSYGNYYTPSYTCRISINDKIYEGFGTTVLAAQNDAKAFCQNIGYSTSICNNNATGCDLDAFNPSGHYKCEVKINDRIYQGLATNKTDARNMALSTCKQVGYSSSICTANFFRCYSVQLR